MTSARTRSRALREPQAIPSAFFRESFELEIDLYEPFYFLLTSKGGAVADVSVAEPAVCFGSCEFKGSHFWLKFFPRHWVTALGEP